MIGESRHRIVLLGQCPQVDKQGCRKVVTIGITLFDLASHVHPPQPEDIKSRTPRLLRLAFPPHPLGLPPFRFGGFAPLADRRRADAQSEYRPKARLHTSGRKRCSFSDTIANVHRHMRVVLGEAMKQRRLLGCRDGRNGGTDSFGRKRLTCGIGGRFGGRLHEIGVDAEEAGEGFEAAGQRADARNRLPFFVPQAPVVHCREPER